jgi:CO/xanthine dehydrogenase Mo-binding subunit
MNIIGKPLRKVDAVSKCIGQTIFADDIFLPQMLYGKETAEEAVRLIRVDYEDLPTVMSIVDGVEPASLPIQTYAEDETSIRASHSSSATPLFEPRHAHDRQRCNPGR